MSAVSETDAPRPEAAAALDTPRPVLDIRNLSIAYRSEGGDVRAVRDVSLALRPGEIVGLAGESGCGKSTLAYGSIRLLRPPAVITAGSVTYHGRRVAENGVDILAAKPEQLRKLRWREIAIVFQSAMNSLNPVLRVSDQLLDAVGAHLPLADDQRQARIVDLIEMVGIPRARLKSYPHELSGGMRQRVMIAMALAAEPEVVIMDEPTTALDVVVQREILSEIFDLRDRLGFSVLFITHDLSLLLEIADRVMIMYAGRVVESGTREQIHRHAAHPYTKGLLTSFPKLSGPRLKLSGIPGSPPDLRGALTGCPFVPRCAFATDACKQIDMALAPVEHADPQQADPQQADPQQAEPQQAEPQQARPEHLTACPFPTTTTTAPPAPATPSAGNDIDGAVVLEAAALTKTYKIGRKATVDAVRGIGVQLRQGTITALVGESGSGKTTVARLLAGQERRSGGEILLDGQPIEPASKRGFRAYKGAVQMVFQDPFASLNPLHTVSYHLTRALRLHEDRSGRAATAEELDKVLTQVRLAPPEQFRDAYPHELSGGQRQRVAIARALAAAPRVLLADEPVSMLDVSIRLEMLDLIDQLRRNLNLAVLYITHDIASARYFADEILVMYRGEIVERGPAEQVTQSPSHEYTRLLIASAPDPDAFGHQLPARREDRAMR